jgi:hypothetical protein
MRGRVVVSSEALSFISLKELWKLSIGITGASLRNVVLNNNRMMDIVQIVNN